MIDTGSFQTLLNFTVQSREVIFKEYFDTSPKNATYRSKSTQNYISCCAGAVNKKIISEIKLSKHFSILSYKVTISSNKEQISVVFSTL